MPTALRECLLCNRREDDNSGIISEDRHVATFLNLPQSYRVLKCRNCDLRWLDPQLNETEYKELYNREYYEGNLSGKALTYEDFTDERQALFSNRLREISEYCGAEASSKKVIDIGAGTGDFVYTARQMDFEAYGYEVSDYARERANRKYNLELWSGDIYRLPIEPHSIDVIHLNHVFEHLTDPHGMLELFREWLTSRGLLVVEVPNQFENLLDMINYLRPGARRFDVRSLHHPYFYTPHSLSILFKQHFFHVEKMRTYYPHIRLHTTNRLKRTIKRSILFIGGLMKRGFIIETFARKMEHG
jgi:trans-aconitate methyltransferase